MDQKMNLQEGTTMDDQITAEAHLETISRSYVRSYSLKAAIDLGIPDIIHSHGQPLTASQLAAKIPINPPADASCLDRLMRLLVHAGVFAEETKQTDAEEGEEVSHYGLTPVSRLLLRDGRYNLSSLAVLNLHPLVVSAWDNLAAWLRSGESHPTAFQAKHGEPLWVKASLDPTINKLFGEAMSSVAKLFMGCMLERCGEVFEGVSSLVDVGGGNGTVAALIAEAFPHIKCMVLDLPHVVAASPPRQNVVAIGGDMLESVPPADAVLLKAILHDWDDKDCVKILRQCREAIPEPGGKVIVVDVVRKKWPHQVFNELQLLVDLQMMVMNNGRERTEEEWKKLFIDAGFSSYKIVTSVGVHSLIEVRP
ncbi:trans-resveratrol di-O-methyltransferase-like [Nymphaea colorata]|nr:trans-resveratrol di-O-methyltransferase-like [Nymphaea colorata]